MLGDNDDIADRNAPDRAPVGPNRGAVVMAPDRGRGYGAYEWFADEPHDEGGIDLHKYLRILAKHWLVILAVMILAIAAGVAKTLLTTKIYTAAVTMQIDREAPKVGDLQTNEPREDGSSDEFFETQNGLLKSRELAVKTVDTNDLMSDANLLNGLGIGGAGRDGKRPSATAIRNQLISAVQGGLSVLPVQRSRLVRITFDSPNPQASARIANTVAATFIKWNLDRRYDASNYARSFLQGKIDEEKVKLEAADRELADYATKNKIINITTATGDSKDGGASTGASTTLVGSSLMAANTALSAAKDARFRAEARYNQSLQAANDLPEVLENSTIQTLKQDLAAKEADYQNKSAIYLPKEQSMQGLQAQITSLQTRINTETNAIKQSLKTQYDAAVTLENQQQAQVQQLQGSFLSQNSQGIEYGLKQLAAATSQAQYQSLLDQFKQVSTAGAITANNITVVDEAQPPHFPSKPQPKKNVITAAMIGLFLGVALAFLIEYLDESIRMPEDVEKKLGLPLLGTIPKLDRGITPAEAMADVRSAFSESYYSVRTALQFSTDEGVPSSLLVTSARPSEGKSTSAVAIASNFARLGLRVLLIDGDLRNPSLHRAMQMENSSGLSNFLTGGAPLARIVQQTSTPCLSFIPCGPLPPNPAELLAGHRIEMLLREARSAYDIVVVDGPPIMGLADGPLLASSVVGTMIVIEAGGTGRNLARVALRRLNVGAPRILGVLLTKFDAKKSSYGYGYGYGYAYDYAYGQKPQIKSGN